MTFSKGTYFSYLGRSFKVLGKWISARPQDEWDIEFIEADTEEVREVQSRKLGYLKKLEAERKIQYLKYAK